jgi:hypothetical protein
MEIAGATRPDALEIANQICPNFTAVARMLHAVHDNDETPG